MGRRPLTPFELDAVQTVAVAAVSLYAGYGLLRLFPVLKRHNVPAAVLGGLAVAAVLTFTRGTEFPAVRFDTALQTPLMNAFFTSIGFSASLALLRAGGGQVVVFLALAAVFATVQGLVGVGVAAAFGLELATGVLMGPAALAGGPATSLAFAADFEDAGVVGAGTLAVAAAMAGIVLGGLVGGPIATALMRRRGLAAEHAAADGASAAEEGGRRAPPDDDELGAEGPVTVADTLRGLTVVLVAMWLGATISAAIADAGVKLPGYVGAMLVGGVLRNLDDATGWLRLPHGTIARIGTVSLTLFLAMALMNVKLWELAALALPLVVNLLVQVALIAAFASWVVFRLMGRDYDAAVMAGGFVGFMLGTTANAMAVMRTLADRYGAAPRAFLVAPLVGAFFIDFTNAMIITTFLNLLR